MCTPFVALPADEEVPENMMRKNKLIDFAMDDKDRKGLGARREEKV